MEASLNSLLQTTQCRIYSHEQVKEQEKHHCSYKSIDVTNPVAVEWITVVDGKFVNHKSECAEVIGELMGKVIRTPWKMSAEEKKRAAFEGVKNAIFEKLVTKFTEEHNEQKVKALSMEMNELIRNDEKKQKTRGDSQIERAVEKEMEIIKNIQAKLMMAAKQKEI
jgi:hypothetical protein